MNYKQNFLRKLPYPSPPKLLRNYRWSISGSIDKNSRWCVDFDKAANTKAKDHSGIEALRLNRIVFNSLHDTIEDIFENGYIDKLDVLRLSKEKKEITLSEEQAQQLIDSTGKYKKLDKRTAKKIIKGIHASIKSSETSHQYELKLLTLTVSNGLVLESFESFVIAQIHGRFTKRTSNMDTISNNDLIDYMVKVGYVYAND